MTISGYHPDYLRRPALEKPSISSRDNHTSAESLGTIRDASELKGRVPIMPDLGVVFPEEIPPLTNHSRNKLNISHYRMRFS